MTKPRPGPRTTGAPGVKQLITAASVAATIAGWALLTPRDAPAAVAPQALQAAQGAALTLSPPVVPTLAPLTLQPSAPAAPRPPAAVAAPAPREVPAPAPVTSTRSSR